MPRPATGSSGYLIVASAAVNSVLPLAAVDGVIAITAVDKKLGCRELN